MPRIAPCLAGATLLAALSSVRADAPPPRESGTPAASSPAATAHRGEPSVLALQDARARVVAAHPRLAAAEASAAAADARAQIAGRPADPEVEFEAESLGGSGAVSGFDAAETSLRLTQPISPPGARGAAAEAARQQARAAHAEADLAVRELRRAADEAFHSLASQQELLALARDRLDRARRLAAIARDRADSGAASPLESLRAEADAGLAEAAVVRAEGDRERAAMALVSLWGGTGDVRVASLAKEPLPEPPAADRLLAAAARHPVLARAAAGQARAAADHRAARAARYGTYGLMGGVQRFEETGDSGFTAGLSVALPLWSRPGAAATAAARDLDAARQAALADARDATASIAAAHLTYTRARDTVAVLEQKSLPAARRMVDGMIEGYRAGKFGLAAVIEAKTAAADIEAEAIEARAQALIALATLDYWNLTGRDATTFTNLR